MKLVSLDIESTGLDKDRCEVLQIGAVIEETEAEVLPPVEALPKFEALIRHERFWAEPIAVAMNAKLIERISKEKLHVTDTGNNCVVVVEDPDSAWLQLAGWLEQRGYPPKWTLAGKNVAGFDLGFAPSSFRENCHHRVIDVGSVALGTWKRSAWAAKQPPNLQGCIPPDRVVEHDAVGDARAVIHGLRWLTGSYGRIS